MHDQCIGVGNVEAGLDDRGREQDVVLAVIESGHDVLDDGRWHLAMRYRHLHLRHVLVEKILHAREVLDARRHVERLPAPVAFAQQRLADHQGIMWGDEGTDCEPVDRWRGNDGQLTHACECQLQRARNRRRA